MEAPAITRSRRPFLLPVWLTLAAALAIITGALLAYFFAYRSATTTIVVLALHAETDQGVIRDPPLSAEGERRAERLAQMFGHGTGLGSLDAIYVSEARRTQQTAAPLSERLERKPEIVPAADVNGAATRILREHPGGKVLVIGHSRTIPELIHALSGLDVAPMNEDEFDTLYVLTIPTFGHANLLRMTF